MSRRFLTSPRGEEASAEYRHRLEVVMDNSICRKSAGEKAKGDCSCVYDLVWPANQMAGIVKICPDLRLHSVLARLEF